MTAAATTQARMDFSTYRFIPMRVLLEESGASVRGPWSYCDRATAHAVSPGVALRLCQTNGY
jgi:hypothetical protein